MQKKSLQNIILFLVLYAGVFFTLSCQNPDAWEERHNRKQPPDKVMDAIGVKPGKIVGEVGAGRGRYVVHMARRVGPEGKVYANDINKNKLKYLRSRCKRENILNIETVLGEVDDPKLPEGQLDVIYVINTYHHLDRKIDIMKNIKPALKPDGIFVIIENEPNKSGWESHATPKDVVIREAGEAGFELVRIEDFLEEDNIYIFKVK
ncbi:2-methoxy-6-polyprenyl-1,4-benzoquinol methylase, mitochondrial [subsurface metagenome]